MRAIQYTPHENCQEVMDFVGDDIPLSCADESTNDLPLTVFTPTGEFELQPGQWLVQLNDTWFEVRDEDPR